VSESIHPAVPASEAAACSAVEVKRLVEQYAIYEGEPAKAPLYAAIDAMQDDARRYRWLRDRAIWMDPPNDDGDMVWCVIGPSALECRPVESDELDAAIDAALTNTQPSSQPARPDETETRQSQPPAPADRVALANEIKEVVLDLSDSDWKADRRQRVYEAIDRLAASDAPPAEGERMARWLMDNHWITVDDFQRAKAAIYGEEKNDEHR
jgi:hypothetical protein